MTNGVLLLIVGAGTLAIAAWCWRARNGSALLEFSQSRAGRRVLAFMFLVPGVEAERMLASDGLSESARSQLRRTVRISRLIAAATLLLVGLLIELAALAVLFGK